MTAAELIARLQAFPADTIVCTEGMDGYGWGDINVVEARQVAESIMKGICDYDDPGHRTNLGDPITIIGIHG